MKLLKIIHKNCNLDIYFEQKMFYIIEIAYPDESFHIYQCDYNNIDIMEKIYHHRQIIGESNNLLCFQESEFWKNPDSEATNYIYNTNTGNLVKSYKTNRNLTSITRIKNSSYFIADQHNKQTLESFNPFTQESLWKIPQVPVHCVCKHQFISLQDKKLVGYSVLTGQELWQFDTNPFFALEMHPDDVEEGREIETTIYGRGIRYNSVLNSVLVDISPDIHLMLDADTGKLLWDIIDHPFNSHQVYRLDNKGDYHYFTYEMDEETRDYEVFYHIMEGKTGKMIHSIHFTDDLQIPANKRDEIYYKPQIGDFHGDYLYFTLNDLGRIYKMNNKTHKIVALNEQKGIFYDSAPVIHQNRLFLVEDNDIKKLWVFEV